MTGRHVLVGAAWPPLAAAGRRLLVLGGAGLLVSLVGLSPAPTRFLQAYLVAYLVLSGLVLGSLALGLLHQLTGGAWGEALRLPLRAAIKTLPAVSLAFLPLLFGAGQLYPWTDAALVASDPVVAWKRPYLNLPFFTLRAAIYFASWNALAYWLNRAWETEARTGQPAPARRLQALGAGGLLTYGLTVTFASFDWVMSLDPHWFSTMFGLLAMAGQVLTALAFAIAALTLLARPLPLQQVAEPADFHDLGKLLLAFLAVWAYLAFSQFLIIWSGNLPEEITWYLPRAQGAWAGVGIAIVALHFVLPFLVLLSRGVKQNPSHLALVAIWVLALRVVETFWQVAPSFRPEALDIVWLDVLVPGSLAVIWLGSFVRQIGTLPAAPPRLPSPGGTPQPDGHTAVAGGLP